MREDELGYAAGIDLGTTYSAAAVYGSGGPSTIDLSHRAAGMPSIVAVRADGEILTGVTAERRLVLEPSRVAREFKRRLGDPTPLLLGGVPYGAEKLTGELLRSIVSAVGERQGEPPTIVGLSHPANYGGYKLDLLTEAARIAGLPATEFVPEPVAASVHYARSERVAVDDVIAVYDLGGGTFDASVVRRTDEGFEVVGTPDGMERFGGIDMDEAVLGHVRRVLGDERVAADVDDPATVSALARLRDECRSAKEALSDDAEVEIPVLLPGLNTAVRLTRPEFEDMIRPRLRETIGVLERAVASAGVSMEDLARVLLVGGSSRIPLVAEMVRQATGRPIGLDVHPKLTVALGTACVAHRALAPSEPIAASPATVAPPPPAPEEPVPSTGGPATEAEGDASPTPAEDPGRRNVARILVPVLGVLVAGAIGALLVFGGGSDEGSGGEDGGSVTDAAAPVTDSTDDGAGAAGAGDEVDGADQVVAGSDRVLAFYDPTYRNMELDGRWFVWDERGSSPPDDIGSDFYPLLGPYSSNDPTVLDQHFAWLARAGIGIVGYDWWGQGSEPDRQASLALATAEDHGLGVAFVIRRYDGRTVDGVADDIAYLYERYGDHPAFHRETRPTPHQGEGPKGLFLVRHPEAEAVGVDGGFTDDVWGPAMDRVHGLPDGGVVLAEGTTGGWVAAGRFDGVFHPLDPSFPNFSWSAMLPDGAWFVPTVAPGHRSRVGNPTVNPREAGMFYAEQWAAAVATGVEPALIAVNSFNDWVAGTQIEPATEEPPIVEGHTYTDYGDAGPEAYLDLTAAHVESYAAAEFAVPSSLRVAVRMTSDFVNIRFAAATWSTVTEVSTTGDPSWQLLAPEEGLTLELVQPLTAAEAGTVVELVFDIDVVVGDRDPELIVSQGCLGVSTIEVFDDPSPGAEPIVAGTGPNECGGVARVGIPLVTSPAEN